MSFPRAKQYQPGHPLMCWLDEKLPLPLVARIETPLPLPTSITESVLGKDASTIETSPIRAEGDRHAHA